MIEKALLGLSRHGFDHELGVSGVNRRENITGPGLTYGQPHLGDLVGLTRTL